LKNFKKNLEKQRGSGNSKLSPPELGFLDKYIRGFRTVKLDDNNYIKVNKKSFLEKFAPKTGHEKQILKYKGMSRYIEFKIKQTTKDIKIKEAITTKTIGDKDKNQKHTLSGMDLFKVQEKYVHLKSQNLVPSLDLNEIAQLFQKELSNGDALENSLNSMLVDIGVNLNDFPKDEKEKLTILFLLA
jgi:hypothetical protein